jgi:glycosyl transferase family 2
MTTPTQETPRLSIVVACQDAAGTIASCLHMLVEGTRAADVACEVIVADASTDGSAQIAADTLAGARIERLPPTSLVPELWSAGIRVARGAAIALTTAHCVPARGWVKAMLEARARGCGGTGGAIECAPGASIVDRAIYFTRYSAYIPPFAAGEVSDLPADNACYDAAALRLFPAFADGPFWEPFLHAQMRARGIRLCRDPAAQVTYVHSCGVGRFLAQRWVHGWHFGTMRSHAESATRSLVRAAAFPLVPPLLFLRVARRVWAHPSRRAPFLGAAPLVLLFLSAFAAGECCAALAAAARAPGRRAPQPETKSGAP